MKPNKRPVKEEPENPTPAVPKVKRKVEKPWILESSIHEESFLLGNFSINDNRKVDTWIKDNWLSGYAKSDIIIEQLNKIARTYINSNESISEHWRFRGKQFRIVNTDTKEIIKLKIKDKEVVIDA